MLKNLLLPKNVITYSLSLFVFLSSLSGCQTSVNRQLSDDSKNESSNNTNKLTDYNDTPSYNHRVICNNLVKIRKFRQFDNCITQFQRHIKNGEMTIGSVVSFLGDDTFNKDYTKADIYGMRAEAALARSDLDKAHEYGLIALKGIEGFPARIKNLSERGVAEFNRIYLGRRVYGVLAVIEGGRGNVDQAKSYMNSLKQMGLSCAGCYQFRPELKYWLARGYFSIGDYPAAYQVLANKELNSDDTMHDIATAINYINPAYYLLKGATGFDMGDVQNFKTFEHEAMICRALYMVNNTKSYSCYQNILKNEIAPFFGAIEFMALQDSGNIELRGKQYDKAEATVSRAIELLESQRSSLSTDTHRMGFVGDKLNVYLDMVNIKLALGKNAEAFEYAERAKSRALVDLLASKQDFSSSNNKLKIEKLLSDLESAEQESLILQPEAAKGGTTRSIVKKKKAAIKTADAQLASLVTVSKPSLSDIQKQLGKHETVLEYYGKGEAGLFAFVVTRSKIKAVVLEASNIKKLVRAYRGSLSDPQSRNYKQTAKALYNAVIKPVKPYIKTKQLTVVPHGVLHYAPFSALYDGKRYLVDSYQIRILPSTSVLGFLNKASSKNQGSMLTLGNPDLGDPSMRLPGAEQEVLRVAKLVPKTKVLLRKKATETALKKYGSEFKQIHFAMHGQFNNAEPLASRLLLAPDPKNDGSLTVSELYGLQFDTDLVTLSACETALGETASGDDVVGFTRGFLYAGARSIVSSLWSVEDNATRDLMVSFYKNLRTKSKSEALQSAQQKVRKKYKHPFFWAAFQLTGRI